MSTRTTNTRVEAHTVVMLFTHEEPCVPGCVTSARGLVRQLL